MGSEGQSWHEVPCWGVGEASTQKGLKWSCGPSSAPRGGDAIPALLSCEALTLGREGSLLSGSPSSLRLLLGEPSSCGLPWWGRALRFQSVSVRRQPQECHYLRDRQSQTVWDGWGPEEAEWSLALLGSREL